MSRLQILFAAAAFAALSWAALGEAGAPTVAGKVVKVEESAGKITIQHGAIPNLDMEAMTMVFKAKDAALLKDVKAGDEIAFAAEKVNGQLTVTSIEKAK